jgi:hypothetical protein
MRTCLALSFVLSLLLFGGGGARAADKDLLAIIDKAIKAHGGAEKLDPERAARTKVKGTMDFGGVGISFTAEGTTQADKSKEVIQLSVNGQEVTIINVFNGVKGWVKADGATKELEGAQLEDRKETAYWNKLESLVFLSDKSLELSPAGETKVNDRPAVGIKVVSKGHKYVKLFFDKESGLLVKSEHPGTDPTTMQEAVVEQIWQDHQDVDGLKVAKKSLVNLDGKKFIEVEFTEVTFPKKLAKDEFDEP